MKIHEGLLPTVLGTAVTATGTILWFIYQVTVALIIDSIMMLVLVSLIFITLTSYPEFPWNDQLTPWNRRSLQSITKFGQ